MFKFFSFNNATVPILPTSNSTSKSRIFFHNSEPITHHRCSLPPIQIHFTAPSEVFKKCTYLSITKFRHLQGKNYVHLFIHFLFQKVIRKDRNFCGQTTNIKRNTKSYFVTGQRTDSSTNRVGKTGYLLAKE